MVLLCKLYRLYSGTLASIAQHPALCTPPWSALSARTPDPDYHAQLQQPNRTVVLPTAQVSYLQVVSLVKNTPVEWPQALVNYFNVVSQVGGGERL